MYNFTEDKSLKHPFAARVRSTNVEYCSFSKLFAIQNVLATIFFSFDRRGKLDFRFDMLIVS